MNTDTPAEEFTEQISALKEMKEMPPAMALICPAGSQCREAVRFTYFAYLA